MPQIDGKRERRIWTEDEITLALALYVQIPFAKIHYSNPNIQALGKALNRSAGSVSFKLFNLAHLDPKLQVRGVSGLSHGGRTDQIIWDRFIGPNTQTTNLSQLFNAADNAAEHLKIKTDDYVITPLSSNQKTELENLKDICETERKRLVSVRLHQNMFRDSVLSAYGWQCALTGLCEPKLIEAAHIKSWALCDDAENRLTPSNGIALSASLHRAYDNNLIGISPDFVCFVSLELLKKMKEDTPAKRLFKSIHGRQLKQPNRFQPNRDYLSDRYSEFKMASDIPSATFSI